VPGRLDRPIVTVSVSIPVPGHFERHGKSCTKIGEATLQFRQRNRREEAERKNDPIPVPCTLVYTCSKNAQIVRRNPALGRARDAFKAVQVKPHNISSQGDPIKQVYIRLSSKTWPDYPPRLTDDVVPMFTYLQRNRSTPALHRPPNAHARRLHYFAQNPRKAFHPDHQHKTSDTGRAARKCG